MANSLASIAASSHTGGTIVRLTSKGGLEDSWTVVPDRLGLALQSELLLSGLVAKY